MEKQFGRHGNVNFNVLMLSKILLVEEEAGKGRVMGGVSLVVTWYRLLSL